MRLAEFVVGEVFFIRRPDGFHQYQTTDVGRRVVVAIRVDYVLSGRRKIPGQEARREGWFDGPTYAVPERVFDEEDQLDCCKTVEELF